MIDVYSTRGMLLSLENPAKRITCHGFSNSGSSPGPHRLWISVEGTTEASLAAVPSPPELFPSFIVYKQPQLLEYTNHASGRAGVNFGASAIMATTEEGSITIQGFPLFTKTWKVFQEPHHMPKNILTVTDRILTNRQTNLHPRLQRPL